jgi:flavin-binding protein dodecin
MSIEVVDVLRSTAVVQDGEIKEYHVDVKVAFVVERED